MGIDCRLGIFAGVEWEDICLNRLYDFDDVLDILGLPSDLPYGVWDAPVLASDLIKAIDKAGFSKSARPENSKAWRDEVREILVERIEKHGPETKAMIYHEDWEPDSNFSYILHLPNPSHK